MFMRTVMGVEAGHHLHYGEDYGPDPPKGAYWYGLTNTEIEVLRLWADPYVSKVRVRIWVVPQADYHSGWKALSPGRELPMEHDLGGNPLDYPVYLEAKTTTFPVLGVNHLHYGVDRARDAGGTLRHYGARWYHLGSTAIVVPRGKDDLHAKEVRVRIWQAPAPYYDS